MQKPYIYRLAKYERGADIEEERTKETKKFDKKPSS